MTLTDTERLQVSQLVALADTGDALQRKLALGALLVLLTEDFSRATQALTEARQRPALRLVKEEP